MGQNKAHAKRPAGKKWLVMVLLCFMYLITYMDRMNLSIIAPIISKEFSFDKITMGIIFSAFSWSYMIFQIPCGYLGDRFGPRRTLGIFTFYWSVLTATIVGAWSKTSFWFARFFLGIGEAGAFPTATRALTQWVPPTERAFAQGLTHAFSRLGAAITPPLTVRLASKWGWRSAFWFFAIVGAVWAIVWYLVYRDRDRDRPQPLQSENEVAQKASSAERPKIPWRVLLRSKNMWAINIQYFAYGYSLWFYLTWLPTYFVEVRQFSLVKTGFYASLPFLTGMVGDTLGGWLCDTIAVRTGSLKLSRRGVGVVAMLATVVFLIPGVLTENPVRAVVLLSISAFFLEMNIGPAWAVVMDVGQECAGTVSGMMNMWGSLAGALSPIIFGVAWDRLHSTTIGFVISGVLMMVGAVAWLMTDPNQSVLVETQT
ncbi:MAG TPA: MFS transporter [Blastocatellia bacterium]|nr:MFS transporter [Blastocatellia bacterium]